MIVSGYKDIFLYTIEFPCFRYIGDKKNSTFIALFLTFTKLTFGAANL